MEEQERTEKNKENQNNPINVPILKKDKEKKVGKTAYQLIKDHLYELILQRKTVKQIAEELELSPVIAQKMKTRLLREVGEIRDNTIKQMRREFFATSVKESEEMIKVIRDGLNAKSPVILNGTDADGNKQQYVKLIEDDKTKLDAVKTWSNHIKTKMDLFSRFGILDPETVKNQHDLSEQTIQVIWGNNETNESEPNTYEDP